MASDDASDISTSGVSSGEQVPSPIVRVTPTRDEADESALVLAAVGLPYEVVRRDDGSYAITVLPEQREAAAAALAAYERDRRSEPEASIPAPERGTGMLGVVAAIGLAAFTLVTGVGENMRRPAWFAAGIADATLIRQGAWWRAVTAMTLHGDLMHLLGNAVASLIFVSAAARWLGSGVAALVLVGAGTTANVLTALVERPEHRSLGASTATFAALGVVAGLQALRRWRHGGRLRRKAWVSFGAGLALFAMLGVSEHSDVFAHLFGLGVGFVAGLLAGLADPRSTPEKTQAPAPRQPRLRGAIDVAAGLGALLVIVAAWLRALRPAGL